jgi:hypothetical protein
MRVDALRKGFERERKREREREREIGVCVYLIGYVVRVGVVAAGRVWGYSEVAHSHHRKRRQLQRELVLTQEGFEEL